jgi:hypothetical protein
MPNPDSIPPDQYALNMAVAAAINEARQKVCALLAGHPYHRKPGDMLVSMVPGYDLIDLPGALDQLLPDEVV